MADKSAIEWTDATWNPITGCSVVSPGCKHCYAMKLAGTRLKHHPSRKGLTQMTKNGPVWTGEVRFNRNWLDQPIRWQRPRMVFVCAHADLFHESVPYDWIDDVFAVMAIAQQHTFQVLTKRPERMAEYLSAAPERWAHDGRLLLNGGKRAEWPGWPLPNVWLGTSVEDDQRANDRIHHLVNCPAAVRWISAEPLLGPINASYWIRSLPDSCRDLGIGRPIHWIVAGGESGPGARPMHPDWPRWLRDHCIRAGIGFHFKQWGAWAPLDVALADEILHGSIDTLECVRLSVCGFRCGPDDQGERIHELYRVGKKKAGRILDGRTWDEWPTK